MTTEQKLKHCAGCRDDVYNHGCGGSQQCWSLSSMTLVLKKEVHINQRPPWTQHAIRVPNCYHRTGYVYVGKDQTH